jgi:hypothetical protein
MRQLVEDAGRAWSSGRLSLWMRLSGAGSGTQAVGSRAVRWAFDGDAVRVEHADAAGGALEYAG